MTKMYQTQQRKPQEQMHTNTRINTISDKMTKKLTLSNLSI